MNTYKYFKYRTINKNLIDSLVRSRSFFAEPSSLNDPFDCNVDISEVVKHAINKGNGQGSKLLREFHDDSVLIEKFRNNINLLGIGSFSLKSDQTLMWSHYANDHKGICLKYEFPKYFLDNGEEIFGAAGVEYEENRVSEWIVENINLYKTNHPSFIIGLLKIVLTSKAPAWKYEVEARIIRPKAGFFDIPREFLTNIIFGLQTSDTDKQLISSIADKYYGNIKFGQAVRGQNDFGIAIEEI